MNPLLNLIKKDPAKELKKVLGEYDLPSFSGVIIEVLRSIRNPASTNATIAETLSVDPGLSVRVLSASNSAVFSPRNKITNLTQAVSLMGLSQLESLILSVGIASSLPREPYPGYDFSIFWRTSMIRGLVSRSLAHILCPNKISECFSAGLLQDMAIPFLVSRYPEKYGPVLNQWHEENGSLVDLEKDHFPWDHAVVGTWMCFQWKLPDSLVAAVGGHHDADTQESECPLPVRLVSSIRDTNLDDGIVDLVEKLETNHAIPAKQASQIVQSSLETAESFATMVA